METSAILTQQEEKKYWWICGNVKRIKGKLFPKLTYWEQVTEKHPYMVIKELKPNDRWYEFNMTNYKQISVEEYNLWNELNSNQ